jgi:hypothetical protein
MLRWSLEQAARLGRLPAITLLSAIIRHALGGTNTLRAVFVSIHFAWAGGVASASSGWRKHPLHYRELFYGEN